MRVSVALVVLTVYCFDDDCVGGCGCYSWQPGVAFGW